MQQNLIAEYEDLWEKTRAIHALLDQNELFRRYSDLNLNYHREVYATIQRLILKRFNFPFTMADFSCGDASMMARILKGTQIKQFIGIDLSSRALKEARQNMKKIPCQQAFIQADFYEIAQMVIDRMDLIWLNLTLHHLSDRQKEILIQGCSEILSGRGCLLVYDPILHEPESREQYISRWWATHRDQIQKLTQQVPPSMLGHAYNDDYPFNLIEHKNLGWENGFSQIEPLYTDPLNCHCLICYSH